MNFLRSFRQHAHVTPSRKPKPEVQQFVQREELSKNMKIKKKVRFEFEDDQISQKDEEKSAGIQVKILMTKEEATQLLSKCKNGGILELKDVADELVQIRRDRDDDDVSTAIKDEQLRF